LFFRKFKTPGLAHVAYLLADESEAAIVDPRRDIEEYLEVAQANHLVIKYVLETHRQEDFVMGSRRLKDLLGVTVVSGEHALFGHSDVRLGDGERFALGGLEIRALHTPGHTPESTCYALYVDAAPESALGVFTGDTLFIGETGRTDLTGREQTTEHAGELYDSVHAKLLPLGDQAMVWPAHGSGSVCGGKIADRDESTLGIERRYNPVFTLNREEFLKAKLTERLPRPPYFRHMERVNLDGGMPAGKRAIDVPLLSAREFEARMKGGLAIDVRDPEAFAGGHVPGSVNVWLAGLPVFAGWLADADTRILLVVDRTSEVPVALKHLGNVGLDQVEGVLRGGFAQWRDEGMPVARSATIAPRELQQQLQATSILDVREDSEFEAEGHIEGALHLYVGYLDAHLHRLEHALKQKSQVAVTCSVGHRAGIAVSLLQRQGIRNATNLLGGMTAWENLELPITRNREHTITTPEIEGERK